MLTILEQDERARERITHEIDRSFFVEAAAGSGKTSSLVDRMAAMVGAGIDVSRICAITFTKAAAKEFYNRFQKKLMKYSREETDQTRRERYAEALRNIDLCFMGTIDSFSNMLLHEHPVDAEIPSETDICEGSDAASAYLAEYARIKRGAYGAELLRKYERFCAVQEKPDEAFARLIDTFTERREAEFVYQPPEDMDVNTPFATWKNKLVQALKMLTEHPELAGSGKEIQNELKNYPKNISVLRQDWNPQIGAVLAVMKQTDKSDKAKNIRLYHDKNRIIKPDDLVPGLTDAFAEKLDNKGNIQYYYLNLTETDAYKRLRKVQYAATMDFLVSASSAISEEICRKGTMTFHDALLRLRNMLRSDAENGGRLIRHISKRHSYYLVDEFQDTDPLQAEVVFYLTAQEPNPDWTVCEPRPGSLFIVGDPKQSIYRFRGADVSSFLRVRSIFEQGAGEVLYLSRNFRSTVKMREMFNEVFPTILEENADVQSEFHQIPIPETDEDTVSTGVYRYTATLNKNCSALKDDGEKVAEVISRLVGNPAVTMKGGKPPQFRDIMVITYGKKKTAVIAKKLSEAGIPVHVEGRIVLNECPALTAAVDLFAAAAAPTDTMSVYQALTSAAFCVPYEMIRDYCSIGGKLNAYYENEDVLPRFPMIQSALAKIKEYAYEGYATDSAALFQMISDDVKLFAITGSEYLEYYCYAVELLRAEETAGTVITHADAAAYLRGLLTDSEEERCVSLSADDNRVHIANLHKVKGLQAPIVILAEPYAESHDPTMRVIHHHDRTECRIFSMHISKTIAAETNLFDSDFNDECECMTAEKQRLLYVAATRAENILIIGDRVKENGDPYDGNPWQAFLPYAEGTVAACIPDNPNEIAPLAVIENGEALYEDAAEQSVLANADVKEPTYATVRPSQMKLRPVTADEADDAPEHEPIDRNAALTGTLVHRLMECIVSGGVPDDANVLISAVLREFDAEDAKYRPLLEKVLDAMTHGGYPQENDAPADLLAVLRQADGVYCEVPFCQQRGSKIVHGVIDLLYRTGDAWHIIDYKTNAERSQLAEKYAAQLDAYKEAVREIIGAAADAAIYHIDV